MARAIHQHGAVVNGLPILAFLTPPPGQSYPPWLIPMQLLLIAVIFYFLLIRPQRKQQQTHQAMLAGLKKNDEVVTTGGVVGKVVHIKDDRVTIQSAESRLVIERDKITRVIVPVSAEEPAAK